MGISSAYLLIVAILIFCTLCRITARAQTSPINTIDTVPKSSVKNNVDSSAIQSSVDSTKEIVEDVVESKHKNIRRNIKGQKLNINPATKVNGWVKMNISLKN